MKLATLTIAVHDDRTTVRTRGSLAAVPEKVLDAAIDALRHERANVTKCPWQRHHDSDGSPKGGDASGSVHDSAGPEDIAQGKQP